MNVDTKKACVASLQNSCVAIRGVITLVEREMGEENSDRNLYYVLDQLDGVMEYLKRAIKGAEQLEENAC